MGFFAPAPPSLGASGAWLAAVTLSFAAINVALSYQTLQSLRTVSQIVAYAFVFVLCAALPPAPGDGEEARGSGRAAVTIALMVAGAGLAAHGLYQSLYGFDRIVAETGGALGEAARARLATGRAVATLGLPGALGGFLAISIPVTASRLAAVLAREKGRRRALHLATISLLLVLQAAGMLATRSGAALGSLVIAAAIVTWTSAGGAPAAVAARRKRAAMAILLIGMAVAGALLVSRLSGPAGRDEGGGPLALRGGNWIVALEIFAENPLVGAGAGCYGVVFPAHRSWGMNESRFAHNTYLQAFAEGGLALGAAALLVAASFAAALRRRLRSDAAATRGEAPFLATACVAFLVHNLIDFTFYLPTVAFAFLSVAGLAIGPWRIPARSGGGARLAQRAAALVIAAFALLVSRADAVRDAARDLALEGRSREALAVAREAVRLDPIDPDARSLVSHLLLEATGPGREELLAEAEREAERAVELDPRTPHHWHHLGRVRIARSDPRGAYVALSRASDLYPIRLEYREDRDAVARALPPARPAP